MQHIVCRNQISSYDIGLFKYPVYLSRALLHSFCYAAYGKCDKF